MKALRIGKLVFSKKSILLIALCIFINGMTIGVMVAYNETNDKNLNFILFYISIFIPYLLMFKTIKSNISETF